MVVIVVVVAVAVVDSGIGRWFRPLSGDSVEVVVVHIVLRSSSR